MFSSIYYSRSHITLDSLHMHQLFDLQSTATLVIHIHESLGVRWDDEDERNFIIIRRWTFISHTSEISSSDSLFRWNLINFFFFFFSALTRSFAGLSWCSSWRRWQSSLYNLSVQLHLFTWCFCVLSLNRRSWNGADSQLFQAFSSDQHKRCARNFFFPSYFPPLHDLLLMNTINFPFFLSETALESQ